MDIAIIFDSNQFKIKIYKFIVIKLDKNVQNKKVGKNKKINIPFSEIIQFKTYVLNAFYKFIKTIHINLKLNLTIATDDAYNTSILYGVANTSIYTLFSYISTKLKFTHKTSIYCDFNLNKPKINFQLRLVFNLFCLLLFFIRISKILLKIKGGVLNGRASNKSVNENYNG